MPPTVRPFHKFVKTQKRQDFVKKPEPRPAVPALPDRPVRRSPSGRPPGPIEPTGGVRRVGPGTRWS
ncbi:hypothetical protein GCM10022225_80910 [Plantactinospora mayteni]|uniref:Uncharacterized protein n=1 Tax=Plantactinospora mayteni TaxID=566021 RepID=A0ABQ4EUY2_9ACTN|nr:hypothetical protein Pma05_50500 [Plantactinospora mayteni]